MSSWTEIGVGRLLERAVRQARADSPRAIALLRSLAGRSLAVRILGTPWHVVVESSGETLCIISVAARTGPRADAATANAADTVSHTATPTPTPTPTVTMTPDATITGGAVALLSLTGADPQAVIGRGDVTITGDAELAQQFRELGMLLRPDLEAGLSRFIGRSGAHVAMRGLRAVVEGTRERAWTATQNIAEYLAHERGDLVSRAEAEHFLRGVDETRERLDRLEARIAQTDQRMRKP